MEQTVIDQSKPGIVRFDLRDVPDDVRAAFSRIAGDGDPYLDKANCAYSNLAALCQKCHLHIQATLTQKKAARTLHAASIYTRGDTGTPDLARISPDRVTTRSPRW